MYKDSTYPVEIISLLYCGIKTKSVTHLDFFEAVSICQDKKKRKTYICITKKQIIIWKDEL